MIGFACGLDALANLNHGRELGAVKQIDVMCLFLAFKPMQMFVFKLIKERRELFFLKYSDDFG